ncbi:MAG: hypothetical protein ACTS6H_02800 [Candidatus Hodgkinia cicadicola]
MPRNVNSVGSLVTARPSVDGLAPSGEFVNFRNVRRRGLHGTCLLREKVFHRERKFIGGDWAT